MPASQPPAVEYLALDDGLRLAYRLEGPPGAPPLVFSNSLGADMRMWEPQVAALGPDFRVLRYDTRGHGRSGVPAGPATLERLGRDLLALLDHLGLERVRLCGISLGGLTAQWLAAHHPERVERVLLANTAGRIGSAESWEQRIAAVRAGGMAAIGAAVTARFFSPAFRAARPDEAGFYRAILEATDAEGYIAACVALRDADMRPALGQIRAPTLIVAGELDESTPPAQAEELQRAIAGSRLAIIPGAAHLSNIERPDEFNALLRSFA